MKNIHIIPTEKGTGSLAKSPNTKYYVVSDHNRGISDHIDYNIFITSDEEIKEGDYIGYPTLNNWVPVQYLGGDLIGSEKKIILTTDQDLIKDGVQSIDDTFLEWFVKNPTCEFVKIHKEKQHIGEEIDESYPKGFFDYKIIIPQEEPKQETLEEAAEKYKYNPKGDFCFTKGAKWQAERMYSEEDMKLSFETGRNFQLTGEDNFNELIEQFKKK
jgi:hypothetical protein